MKTKKVTMKEVKRIGMIAHDHRKPILIEWALKHKHLLDHHQLYATGTTGQLLEDALKIPINKFQSGPLGGDQQIGALIAEGKLDFLVFFWDPLQPMPHDPDVKALLRLAVVWNIPVACNRSTADFLFTSSLMHETYQRQFPDLSKHQNEGL